MRRGSVYRRCSKCGVRLPKGERRCKCGHGKTSWAFRIDLASAPGMPREMKWQSGFKTERAAQDELDKIRNAKKEGTYVEPTKLTLAEYLDQWLQAPRNWSANCRRDYEGSVERFIKPRLGTVRLQDLTTTRIEAFYGGLLKQGVRGPLSRKSVHNIEICLRSALSRAVRSKLLQSNPASGAFDYKPRQERKEMRIWSAAQVTTFLTFTADDQDAAIYRVALMTGMRRGEILGLRRENLDIRGSHLDVRQQWTRDGANGLAFVGLKNDSNGWRTIDLDPVTVRSLGGHLEKQVVVPLKDALVFANPDGSPLDPDSVGRRFGRCAGQAGLPHLRFHDMRHTHATLLLESGENVRYVAERLGDSTSTVLETYAHVTPRMREVAVSRLAALIDG